MIDRLSLRQRQQIRNHQDLVDATLRLICRHGLDQVTIDNITSEAGMSRGTLYAYFPDGLHAVIREAYITIGDTMITQAEQQAAATKRLGGKNRCLLRCYDYLGARWRTRYVFQHYRTMVF